MNLQNPPRKEYEKHIKNVSELFRSLSPKFASHRQSFLKSCFIIDNCIVLEQPKGRLKEIASYLNNVLLDYKKYNNLKQDKLELFLMEVIKNVGSDIRFGRFPFVNHASFRSPPAKEIDWLLNQWIGKAISLNHDSSIDEWGNILMDLEVIAPAQEFNSTIAQTIVSILRLSNRKPIVSIPYKQKIKYNYFIRKRYEDEIKHFVFKKPIG